MSLTPSHGDPPSLPLLSAHFSLPAPPTDHTTLLTGGDTEIRDQRCMYRSVCVCCVHSAVQGETTGGTLLQETLPGREYRGLSPAPDTGHRLLYTDCTRPPAACQGLSSGMFPENGPDLLQCTICSVCVTVCHLSLLCVSIEELQSVSTLYRRHRTLCITMETPTHHTFIITLLLLYYCYGCFIISRTEVLELLFILL